MSIVRWGFVSGPGWRRSSWRAALPRRVSGFTIVELVLVIVIIGVLSALAGPRFFDRQSFSARAYAEEVASALRYAQKIAVGSGCRVRVVLAPGGYTASQQTAQGGHCNTADNSYAMPVYLSTGQAAAAAAPGGVTLAPPVSVVYDALGRVNLAADQQVNIGPHTLTIEAVSGLVVGP